MQGAFIEDLTWVEVKRQIEIGVPVLIPIGAAAKAHSRHLGGTGNAAEGNVLLAAMVDDLVALLQNSFG